MKKLGRTTGKRSYAIVDELNKVQVVLDSGNLQKIYTTKVSALNHLCSGIGLKVVPVKIILIKEKSKIKKHG
jgi:hypothetical protein